MGFSVEEYVFMWSLMQFAYEIAYIAINGDLYNLFMYPNVNAAWKFNCQIVRSLPARVEARYTGLLYVYMCRVLA